MTLKARLAINLSLLFSVIFAVTLWVVYYQFSEFRKEEFRDRLEEKALTTLRLLIDVKEVDNQILKLVDVNSIHKLYDEKTIIFNKNFELIYSSVDDAVIHWSKEDLKLLQREQTFYRTEGSYDVFGIHDLKEGTDYYAIVSAEDKYGIRKISYLSYLLFFTYIIGTSLLWLTTIYLVRKALAPLDDFQKRITAITENKLTIRLEDLGKSDELSLLSRAFNDMMLRLENSYIRQKEFTAHAGHELRTPLARMITRVENIKSELSGNETIQERLSGVLEDASRMAELISSLLILSKAEDQSKDLKADSLRLDELIFSSVEQVQKQFPAKQFQLNMLPPPFGDLNLEVLVNENLAVIAFSNLLRNACLYGDNDIISIRIYNEPNGSPAVAFENSGETLSEAEQQNLFEAFMRGGNAQEKSGTGLGLRIAKRIFGAFGARLEYRSQPHKNIFSVIFSD